MRSESERAKERELEYAQNESANVCVCGGVSVRRECVLVCEYEVTHSL